MTMTLATEAEGISRLKTPHDLSNFPGSLDQKRHSYATIPTEQSTTWEALSFFIHSKESWAYGVARNIYPGGFLLFIPSLPFVFPSHLISFLFFFVRSRI
ncbi:hypothetical protein BDW02DRAFT_329371 [Decorospora gaudefroyi]|uniref:Uncharacterized protein n=1 Tax=Decorospora gaudefroyi TaxID=184978 RepID=A0A6A5K9N1_9PLEO|nr:hypothetical protein BDW02DRAFT_329371 [Decorospora gaudefroyi]